MARISSSSNHRRKPPRCKVHILHLCAAIGVLSTTILFLIILLVFRHASRAAADAGGDGSRAALLRAAVPPPNNGGIKPIAASPKPPMQRGGGTGGAAAATTDRQNTSTSTGSPALRNDFMGKDEAGRPTVWADLVWENLLEEGQKLSQPGMMVLEVGMHTATQCLQAAEAGFEAHCVEPSPASFERIQRGVDRRGSPETRARVHLYNRAAGAESGISLDFRSSGSTGDHVGTADMWTMTKPKPDEHTDNQKQHMVQVESLALDEIIPEDGAYLLKVDTQGFEPAVFAGLKRSISQHKIQYIMTEYWPRGIDFLSDKPESCSAIEMLQQMIDAGYTLYAMVALGHPAAPVSIQLLGKIDHQRPSTTLLENCRWYYDLEKQYPSDDYKYGYWSDIVAVAPNARLPDTPSTTVGKILVSAAKPSRIS